MARSYSSRESRVGEGAIPLSSFKSLLEGLPTERVKAVSESIFFDVAGARDAARSGYGGPSSKNSFAWFKPEVEKEVHERSVNWAKDKADLLGKIWDAAEKTKYPDGSPKINVANGLIAYDDRQTFIDRHLRFIAGDYKQVFQSPMSKALQTVFASKEEPKIRSIGSDFTHNDKMRELVDEWNKMASRETEAVREDAFRWFKSKVG